MKTLPSEGSGFAITYKQAGRIEFYDSTARRIGNVETPYPSVEQFALDTKTHKVTFKPRRLYYFDCAVVGERLYALFSGRLLSALQDNDPHRNAGQFIHVFDKLGKLVEVLTLDREVSSIEADIPGNALYGVNIDESFLHKFTLPSQHK